MENNDYDLLQLIKDWGIKQNDFSDKIGINASQMTRKLSPKYKEDFTPTELMAIIYKLKLFQKAIGGTIETYEKQLSNDEN